MLLKRIKAQHFKTYQNLDLDLTVPHDRPIILIGGANGGGKTTLFEAIYGGLYGLKIKTARDFEQHLNARGLSADLKRPSSHWGFAAIWSTPAACRPAPVGT